MVAAFLGSWLLFTLELITARLLLPAFGGAAWVWTAALGYYQALLFAAYLYTTTPWARKRRVHLALLALSLPFVFARVQSDGGRLSDLLWALLPTAPLFFVLSTTSPIIQPSLEARLKRPVYELYAWSNAGALLALLSYPVLLEPLLPLSSQLRLWAGLYALYCALAARAVTDTPPLEKGRPELSWVLMAMGPSAALASATGLLMLDFAAVPLIWVVPLALYLLTFIVTFKKDPWEPRKLGAAVIGFMALWLLAALLTARFSADLPEGWALAKRLWTLNKFLFVNGCLFMLCLVAHRALAARKPAGRAPVFYACLALGGWLGSAWIAWVMPFAARRLAMPELDWALAGVFTIGVLMWHAPDRPKAGWKPLAAAGAIVGLGAFFYVRNSPAVGSIEARRNLYGFYRVSEQEGRRYFFHGNTVHGMEVASRPGEPVLYYHKNSPMAELFRAFGPKAERVAVLGLGGGAAAAYARKGQRFDFYELDGDVVELARKHFSFLDRSPAAVSFIEGDARVQLARSTHTYDLIFVDVFSGGAIPVHMLTREALQLYEERLSPGGVIILHITNRFLELRPVAAALAEDGDWHGIARVSPRSTARPDEEYGTTWAALSRRPLKLEGWTDLSDVAPGKVWTDEHAALWSALR